MDATAKATQRDHRRLLSNLKMLQRLYTSAALIDACGIPRATYYYKMREPWKHFSYDEFKAIAKYCNISLDTLLEGELKLI